MRTRAERKHNTWRKILKKLKVIKHLKLDEYTKVGKEFTEEPHRLAKDKFEDRRKPHTNNKTKRHMYGNYQSSRNYKVRDLRQIEAGKAE